MIQADESFEYTKFHQHTPVSLLLLLHSINTANIQRAELLKVNSI